MAITLKDVAEAAGVRKSTASVVINNKEGRIKISDRTRRRIFDAVKNLNYHPNAAARALTTKRTGYIGFVLSESNTPGWTDEYNAKILTGVETVCRQSGYGLAISRYNLSNIDSFVFPEKVGQRSVDGLILTGYTEAAVLAKFREFGIPCILAGANAEIENIVPTLALDAPGSTLRISQYVTSLGHRSIAYCMHDTPPTRSTLAKAHELFAAKDMPDDFTASIWPLAGAGTQASAVAIVDRWRALPEDERPTCLLGPPKLLVGILDEFEKHRITCPADVSLISLTDTFICQACRPKLTASHTDMETMGKLLAQAMVDHLDKGKELPCKNILVDIPTTLACRESCGPAPR